MTSTRNTSESRRARGWSYWYCAGLGALLVLLGVVLGAGGAWLIALGGSWYYLVGGIGLVVSGILLIRPSMAGVGVYLATYVFTIIWAFWEVGTDWWAQVPRLVAPTVILILVLLAIPAIGRPRRAEVRPGRRTAAAAAVALLFLTGAGVAYHMAVPSSAVAQATPPGEEAPAEPAPETDPAPAPKTGPAAVPEGASPTTPPGEQPSAPPRPGETAPTAPAQPSATQAEAAGPSRPPMPQMEVGADWPAYGGTYFAHRYSPLDQIDRNNVSELQRVWTYRTGDMPSEAAEGEYAPETTPVKVGNYLYLCSAMNILISVHAGTGKEQWRYDPQVHADAIPYSASCRGVAYFENPAADPDSPCARRVMEATIDARLIAVDADTGQPCPDFGFNGQVNLREGIGETVPGWYAVTAPPTIVRGVAVVGAQVNDGQAEDAPSGVVRGYDAVTGELVWAWDMCKPDLRGEPPEGEVYTRGTPNMWTTTAADEELGYVYLPTGNSAVDYYGGNRADCENEYSTALVAIDATTGEEVWHFQSVHYDVWDYDLGSQPTLIDFPAEGGSVPAIILPSKQGDIYILDRRTGESLFPVEERPVPTGGVEPENLSDTQPFSAYHTLAKDPLEERDMWGISPLDQLWCRIQFHRATYDGIYTPPTLETHFIQYPGYNGGSDWGSVAVDMERGILVANYNDMPNFNRLLTREEADERDLTPIYVPHGEHDNPQVGAPYAIDVNAGWRLGFTGLMCKQPPYGGIRAIDLETGETIWDHPLGEARANGPFGIPSMLPIRIGTPNNGGPLITAGGLIFIAAATDNLIRAIDIDTGEVLWEDELPAGGQATPITFEVQGRQYIVFMAGGHHFMETPIGDYVLAWALPMDDENGTSQ
ncbi:membrane-bound PQQ-dependent dehydrogenase, glucose/quinate/shikimate family [Chelativorans sp. AA-79]|uniref:membrane-bound PQQ-dependent dehydrogenase, glucose/quinate/shikimate family n=1 Tax=Chelativorans sp. AA-79 TaxID=3028735 RepID=UPI0023F6A39B|nr:membrane-bound PQQ-dependent dehydrogenase, glucose/quinate/shikimate family [Chelativorans sp. AA-79]WEX10641.1 membrane-bound PQQ-dependent dehydrogenase, glucose/quinate/shikimate family [Chelativorans sp. AA-79]